MNILAVDTSCDDTSVAVISDGRIISNIISSQIEFHKKWGGVVPIIAKRNHIERIDHVISKALRIASLNITEIDAFAVTYGPGLAIALEVGVNKIKELAKKYNKKVIAVNHMIGHIYANFAKNKNDNPLNPKLFEDSAFPLIALLISGGHTEIIYMKDHLEFEKIGETQDDSVGEAFDKVASMMGLGYPGGPVIEELAKQGDGNTYDFPVPMRHSKDFNFSYSGLKTAVLRTVKDIGAIEPSPFEKAGGKDVILEGRLTLSKKNTYSLSKEEMQNISASFQKAAAEELKIKLVKAMKSKGVKNILLGGGVANNSYIRKILRKAVKDEGGQLFYPKDEKLLTDNAGMIGIAACYIEKKIGYTNIEVLDRDPRLDF